MATGWNGKSWDSAVAAQNELEEPTIPQDNLVLWLDADDPPTLDAENDGDLVGLWRDKSAAGRDAAPVTELNKPTFKTNQSNGRPCVRFDGVNDYVEFTEFLAGKEFTFFCVVNIREAPGAYSGLLSHSDGSAINNYSAGVYWNTTGSGDILTGGNGSFTIDALAFVSIVRNYDGGASAVKVNGSGLPLNNPSDAAGPINQIGRTYSGDYSQMDVFEVIIYDGLLSAGDFAAVESYLSSKWS